MFRLLYSNIFYMLWQTITRATINAKIATFFIKSTIKYVLPLGNKERLIKPTRHVTSILYSNSKSISPILLRPTTAPSRPPLVLGPQLGNHRTIGHDLSTVRGGWWLGQEEKKRSEEEERQRRRRRREGGGGVRGCSWVAWDADAAARAPSLHPSLGENGKNKEWLCDSPTSRRRSAPERKR